MRKKQFLFPWQKQYVIICPKCGGRIETQPLFPLEKRSSKFLQHRFCHALDSELLEKIPVLSENDQKSWGKWIGIEMDLRDYRFGLRPRAELYDMFFKIENGLPKIVNKHGIFALFFFLNRTELEVLFLFLGLKRSCPLQAFFKQIMGISRSYVSTILKKLASWRLIEAWKPQVKGRAHGRQLAYRLSDRARETLEEDMQNYDFFRNIVAETIGHIAKEFPAFPWRKGLVGTNG